MASATREAVLRVDASMGDVVIVDIEGTVTPLPFVAEILFPYCRHNVRRWLSTNIGTEKGMDAVSRLRSQHEQDTQNQVDSPAICVSNADESSLVESVLANVLWNMDRDRKIGALKHLQGLVWREGYASGELKGEVFDDVPPALQRLKEAGVRSFVYSSGSIEAQKLLFGFSIAGDLLPYFDGHFDTTTGPKLEAASYSAIANAVGVGAHPSRALFLSDHPGECDAAVAAGMRAAVVIRPRNNPLADGVDSRHVCIQSLAELSIVLQ